LVNNNNKIGLGWQDDAFFANVPVVTNSLQLPTMWNIFSAIQHYWVPDVRT